MIKTRPSSSNSRTSVSAKDIFPAILPIEIDQRRLKREADKARARKQWLLIFVIGTKPCFYKFWGCIKAAEEAGLPFIVVNSGQHYDSLLTHGVAEFSYEHWIAADLNIRGDLARKAGELLFKMNYLSRLLAQRWPGVTAVPVVLGDTIMTSVVPMSWYFSRNEKVIQNEAGLRSMSPIILRDMALGKRVTLHHYVERQQRGPWERLTNEPYPEQYDTFTSAAGSEFLFAPTELNKRHLIQEGYPPENIFVIGGAVVDALDLMLRQKPTTSIFNVYPQLRQGEWIRIDIHRKENLTYDRFHSIVGAIELLVHDGFNVNFVEMNATRVALKQYGLRKRLLALKKKKNFLYTSLWPEYSQVIEFYRSKACGAALTDSGGLQEELNILHGICLTCRFNTDRPETVQGGNGNILVPPISADFIFQMVKFVSKNNRLKEQLRHSKPQYGTRSGAKFAAVVEDLMSKGRRPFSWAHERLGFLKNSVHKTPFL